MAKTFKIMSIAEKSVSPYETIIDIEETLIVLDKVQSVRKFKIKGQYVFSVLYLNGEQIFTFSAKDIRDAFFNSLQKAFEDTDN